MVVTRSTVGSARLLTTLTSTSTKLVPPYSHSSAVPQEPSPALRPPYAHAHAHEGEREKEKGVQPKLKYALLDRSAERAQRAEAYRAWAAGLGDEEAIKRVWNDTLVALQAQRHDGTQVPEIPFHELAQHLGTKSTVRDLRKIGMVVVRDVIADKEAQAVGEEIRQYTQDIRAGHPSYWHELLLALRANPSVLSANAQVTLALTGKEAKYIRADTLSCISGAKGSGGGGGGVLNMVKPWSTPNAVSAHFTLSPSRSGTYQTVPSIHAARYAALRPLFSARQSLISFYDKQGYLDASNWTLSSSSSSSGSSEGEGAADLPHLSGANVGLPALRPGDLVYSHALLPIRSTKPATGIGATDFVPLHPLAASSSQEVTAQKEAFEAGLPPPHVLVDGTVALEEGGHRDILRSNGGRTAMGY